MKILVIDDHPLVRDAMAHLVEGLGGEVEVLGAPDCATGLEYVGRHADIELVLLDLHLPGLRGIPALERIRRAHPTLPVVVISASRDRDTVVEVMRRGAVGYIPKSSSRETIVNALRLILAGSVYVPPEAAFGDSGPHEPASVSFRENQGSLTELGLTARQGQVLALLMQGLANKEICRELGLAERTVKAHLTAVLNAFKVTSRTQAVIAANRLGLDPAVLLTAVEPDA